uniref:HAT C-terminal dimerisation domain-containing protein n=1 Tax=Gouania willdenowi TaxID=441366 RepID=A0A8C5H9P6_GOUWI
SQQKKFLTKEKQELMVSWYREDLPQPDSINQEIHRWMVKNQPPTGLAATAKETLNQIDKQFYPNIHCNLTLPVTTCSCERSFSALRWLKNWLRSSMGNNRLSGLAMMHMHKNRALDPEQVLRCWDATGRRRISLVLTGLAELPVKECTTITSDPKCSIFIKVQFCLLRFENTFYL